MRDAATGGAGFGPEAAEAADSIQLGRSSIQRIGRPAVQPAGPLFIVYTIANETDGNFTRGFDIVSVVTGTLRNAGPAFVLLLPVWAYTGWMERRGFSVTRVLVNHRGQIFPPPTT